jgi:hypothetical protein
MQNSQIIDAADILYCYISDGKVSIVLLSGEEIKTRYSLKFLEEVKLKNIKTIRCHAKILVSMEHRIIYNSGFRKIILCNGIEVTVAKDRKKIIKRILNEFN